MFSLRVLNAPEQKLANAGPQQLSLGSRAGKTLSLRKLCQERWFSEVRAVFGKVISNKFTRVPRVSGTKEAEKTQAPGGLMGLARGETGSRVEDPWDPSAENRISEHQS